MNLIERFLLKIFIKKWRDRIMLSGYKTYIIGVAFVLYGVSGYILGMHDVDTMIHRVLEGLAFMGLRAGVAKIKK